MFCYALLIIKYSKVNILFSRVHADLNKNALHVRVCVYLHGYVCMYLYVRAHASVGGVITAGDVISQRS